MSNLPANSSVRSPAVNGISSPMSNLSLNNNHQAPAQQPVSPPPAQTPTPAPASSSYYSNEKQGFPEQPAADAPPAYPAAPAAPTALCTATALYAYQPTDAGDLGLQANDKISVTEYMNAEWWKGRSERTGEEGIFPRTYVRVEEEKLPLVEGKNKSSDPKSYGNLPMSIGQSGSASGSGDKSKTGEYGKKFGKKMGNAAIFGAGATIGSNIVNGIF
jgi:LAS seventeen-binding protein 1/2